MEKNVKNNLKKLVAEKGVIYDYLNDIFKEEANYFPSHPLPLNEDYGN